MKGVKSGLMAAALLVASSVDVIAGESPKEATNNGVRVLLDSKCHQGIRHLGAESVYYGGPPEETSWQGKRLVGLQSALESKGFVFEVADITASNLSTCKILVIASRSDAVMFSDGEVEAIGNFVRHGGSLLLMANHSGFVAPQNQLTNRLGLPITFNPTTVIAERQKIVLSAGHPMSTNCDLGLQIRISCTMSLTPSPHATVIARYTDPTLGAFAVAVDRPQHGEQARSRTVAMPTSGHIASLDDSDADLWGSANNATWMLNIFEWLAYRMEDANRVNREAVEVGRGLVASPVTNSATVSRRQGRPCRITWSPRRIGGARRRNMHSTTVVLSP